ncbi:hypothetical protein V6N13_076316 [Hibiscus sabdariffa]
MSPVQTQLNSTSDLSSDFTALRARVIAHLLGFESFLLPAILGGDDWCCLIVSLPWSLFISSGCFGCCTKPTPIIAVDQPSKGLRIRGRIVRKPSISDDFWSSSTYELENSALQSQRSLSSISASNQTLSQCSSSSGMVNSSDFVNQGLVIWNQARLQWVGSGRHRNHTQRSREPRLSSNASYESLLGTRNPFPQPILLSFCRK